ncbi:MAG: DNA alkylation repair protein [Rhodospirillales bacterium]|nr:DNA alkylation repair protein [Rhodospirillales bacterium]
MSLDDVLRDLNALPRKADGTVYVSAFKPLARRHRNDHALALALWDTGTDVARQLAVRIADPSLADDRLLETWVNDLDEWSLTDAFTAHVVRPSALAIEKSHAWAQAEPTFVRRAGFATVAQLAWLRTSATEDMVFLAFLPRIEAAATDERFYVKKAVNWALRDIAKRNDALCEHATALAMCLMASDDTTARWVGRHRCKEFLVDPA